MQTSVGGTSVHNHLGSSRQHHLVHNLGKCLVASRESASAASCSGSPLNSLSNFQPLASRQSVRVCGFREQAVIDFTPLPARVPLFSCVEDVMTKSRIYTCRPDTTVDEALEILVKEHITGMPVIDDKEQVVGVVSDFDMLSLDGISGKMRATGMFPDTNTEWSAFFEVQKLLLKNRGKTVADVMTPDPMVVRGNTDIEAAARLLLERRIRRMPVVDSQGRLIGIFSRGDVIRAALQQRRATVEAGIPVPDSEAD